MLYAGSLKGVVNEGKFTKTYDLRDAEELTTEWLNGKPGMLLSSIVYAEQKSYHRNTLSLPVTLSANISETWIEPYLVVLLCSLETPELVTSFLTLCLRLRSCVSKVTG